MCGPYELRMERCYWLSFQFWIVFRLFFYQFYRFDICFIVYIPLVVIAKPPLIFLIFVIFILLILPTTEVYVVVVDFNHSMRIEVSLVCMLYRFRVLSYVWLPFQSFRVSLRVATFFEARAIVLFPYFILNSPLPIVVAGGHFLLSYLFYCILLRWYHSVSLFLWFSCVYCFPY